ncbi:MAG: ATP-binding protein, partial [Candidatus Thiodiazotropha sp.]
MRYFKSKINRKVVAITLLPAILVTLLLSLSSSLLQTSAMEKSLSERGLAIVRQLAPACEYGVYSANQDFLRPIVESVMNEPNVVSVTVLDAKGHLLINSGDSSFDRPNIGFNSTQPGIIQPTHNINWIFYAPIYQTKLLLQDYSSESIDNTKTTKSWVSTDNILGWVSIEISLSELISVKRSAWFNTAAIAGIVLLIGTLLALSMGRSITTPISKLMHAVNKVESGDLDFKIDTGASGELKALERAFNRMSKALKETRQEQENKIDKATEELRNVLQTLAENNAELESARLKAETASREKSAFLANISHEIRTPLHGAKGFMQLLSETQLQDEQKVYIDRINTSVNTLTTLLNDILDFSRLEVSKLKLEYCDFNPSDMLDDIVRIYAWEANNKGLELIAFSDHNTPHSLHGCSSRIAQVLRNLVSNAIKFTQRGEICIRLEKMTSDNHFRFSVTDTGIGISPHERDNLFEPFSQLESGMSRNYAGVGLGLVISKALAELMDGQIYVNSIVGVGTCFSLE